MEGTTEFFSVSHKRVLSIATWARYLAWVALVIGVLGMAVSALQTWNSYQISQTMGVSHQVSSDLAAILRNDPFFLFNLSCYLPKEVDRASEDEQSDLDFKTFGSDRMN